VGGREIGGYVGFEKKRLERRNEWDQRRSENTVGLQELNGEQPRKIKPSNRGDHTVLFEDSLTEYRRKKVEIRQGRRESKNNI